MHTAYLVKIRQGDIIKSRVKHVDTEMEKYDKYIIFWCDFWNFDKLHNIVIYLAYLHI